MNNIKLADLIILRARMSVTETVNAFLYFLKCLPVFKQKMSDRVYSFVSAKTLFAVFGLLFSLTKRVMTDLVTAFCVFLLATLFAPEEAAAFPMFVPLFISLCFISAVFSPKAYSPSERVYIYVRVMRMDARSHALIHIIANNAVTAVCYMPSMLLMIMLTDCGAEMLLLPLIWYAIRICVSAADLYIKDKRSRLGTALGISVSLLSVAVSVLVAVLTGALPDTAAAVMISLITVIPAVPAMIYILRFKGFRELIIRECTSEKLQSISSETGKENFKDVEIPDKISKSAKSSIPIGKSSPAAYLTRVFYRRHTRLLLTPAVIASAVTAVLLAAVLATGYLAVPDLFAELANNIAFVYQALTLVLYLISTSPRACKAMFYNCDISLLRMPFYREPKLLLRVFTHRLLLTGAINLFPALAVGISLSLINALGGGKISDCILLPSVSIMLSLFFTVYHLAMYYLFQPYTTSLETKNPFFSISNAIVYIVCYILFEIEIPIYGFAYTVLGITVLATAVSLTAVYKFAPKRFRIK